jgi:anion-transporting  ArsA/GET3 family ATPase
VFVTGKGGVGKSTVAVALARVAARRGLRTLLCEMDAKGSVAARVGGESLTFEPRLVEPNLWAMVMDTEQSLREYLRLFVRIPLLTKVTPLAAIFDFVADAAPGVKEILGIGKLCHEVRQDNYDIVIVDSEATGHIVSQIAAPRIVGQLAGIGMLRDQTEWMAHILEDESKCTVVPVVVPEELVVKETIDLVKSIRSQTKTDVSWVVLNRTEAPLVPTTDEPTWVALREVLPPSTCGPLERAVRVRELQRVALDELKDAIDDLGYIVMPEIGGWGDDGSLLEVDTILVERLGEEL